ncbi:hypothetical protein BC777_2074 [Yoonia maricola]|uniref:Uncharacterized protein n=1 Tax=Yoonia maricola TaxID=420999 RepID=A0A2M8WQK3_9RHOB|nr:hypothetical protein [Yoonia maricola]PJI93203.1 hypothetical protein BC777_2074 [Yoonia maricola]
MPKEIDREPRPLRKNLESVRITFEELTQLLERLSISHAEIEATSNGAKFEGLSDIKSAPARFAGNPFIQIPSGTNGELAAKASIEFHNETTEVSAGWYKGGNTHSSADDALANTLYEELKPFESTFFKRLSWLQSKIMGAIFIGIAALLLNTRIENTVLLGGGLLLTGISSVSLIAIWLIRDSLGKAAAVSYNPRETFWQRHGESSIVGIFSSVVTGVIVWYLTSP